MALIAVLCPIMELKHDTATTGTINHMESEDLFVLNECQHSSGFQQYFWLHMVLWRTEQIHNTHSTLAWPL